MLNRALLIFIIIFYSSWTHADFLACQQHAQIAVHYLRCLDQHLNLYESELTVWVNQHLLALEKLEKETGRTDPLKIFNKGQKFFKKYRENDCKHHYLILMPDINSGAIKLKECHLQKIEQRIAELKQNTIN